MNVLVIPEDFRKDQYVLRPVLQKMFEYLGKPQAKVQVCLDPLLGGIGEALKWENISEIIEMYPMIQIFLLIVDRDGNGGRRTALDNLELKAEGLPGNRGVLIAENAWQEIEVWALAGLKDLPKDWKWKDVRDEVNPKEVYFQVLAKERNLLHEPGQGRDTLGKEAARNYKSVRSRCKEDVQNLETRITQSKAFTQ